MINEIGVMVKKSQPELIKEINSYKLTLQHMEYEIEQCKEDNEDCLYSWWQKHGKWYSMTWDRMVIASHSCMFLYENDSK